MQGQELLQGQGRLRDGRLEAEVVIAFSAL